MAGIGILVNDGISTGYAYKFKVPEGTLDNSVVDLTNIVAGGSTDSPAFTGIPTAPTAPVGTDTTQLATTAFVTAADNLKAPLDSPTFTGIVTIPTPINATDAATKGYVDSVTQNQNQNQITVGNGLTKANSTISIDTTITTDLTSVQSLSNKTLVAPALGTPVSGILTNCTFPILNQNTTGTSGNVTGIVLGANGGTGIANTGKTITLGGNLVTSGAYGTTLVSTATTTVTLPTSGTLSTLAGIETLSNKTLVAPALGTPASGVMTNVTGTATGLTAGNVVTNANLTGAITSVGNTASLGSFTSTQLATALSDKTGTGYNVFANSPTLVTPNIGVATGTSFNGITGLSTISPSMNGTASIGVATTVALADHVHPSDTSKAPIASPTFTGTVSGITKSMVGLGSVDNTSDLSKPISTATQSALNLKVDSSKLGVANGIATLDANALIPASQLPSYVDDVLEFSGLASFPTTGEAGKIYVALDTNKTYRWSGSVYVYITSGAVDSVAGKTGIVTLVKADVGLGSVDNTSDLSKPISTATQTALDLKAPLASPTFTGTVAGIDKTMVGLGSVDNTSDLNKPISTSTQSALDLKAPLASPTFTGTVSGITKAMVSLGSVDNTSDVNKPVSTATQSALDLKANLTSAVLVTPNLGTPSAGNLANCTFPTLNQNTTGTSSNVTGVVLGANGGTGVANTGKTITLGGNLTTSGAFATTITSAATTSVTLPTSGTLVGSADTGTVTNTMLAGSIADSKLNQITTASKVSNTALTGTLVTLGSTALGANATVSSISGLTLVTPTLGVASATTINKVTLTAPATGSTLTIADGATLATAGAYSTTLTSTATTAVTLPTTGTLSTLAGTETLSNKTLVAPALGTPTSGIMTNVTGTATGLTAGNVITNANLTGAITSVGNTTSLGSFTSAQLATALTDETGTGANVFAISPTLVTPNIGVATGSSFNGITGLSSTTPSMDGVATIGTATTVALADHIHPKDTSKQDTLVSGTNIKTINGSSLLGSGNISISGSGGASAPTDITVNIPSSRYSSNISITDASATTTSRILAFPNGFTSNGLLGGDELEMTPLVINAYCTVNGTINMIISSSQGPIKGTYGISYSIQ
ncbi:MAG: hypothetical protein JHC33_07855 [Ignisphaera sp.]|nr:hypothetical protein [Ignisphaera sp.]